MTTVYSFKEQILLQARDERRRELTFYVTREELGRSRELDRDRLDAKLDQIQVEVRALGMAVARSRR